MNKVFSLAKVLTLAIALSFGLSYVYAWTAPTSNPPAGNVAAPINTSNTPQTKAGDLTLSNQLCLGGVCRASWPTGGGSYTDTDTLATVMNRGNVAPVYLNMNNNSITGVSNLSAGVINDSGALSVGSGTGISGEFYQSPGNYFRIPGPFSPIKGASSYGDGKVLTSDAAGYATWQTPTSGGVTSFNGATGAVTGVTSVNGQTGGPSGAVTVGVGNTVTLYSGQTNGATYGAHTKCSASADTFCANVVTCRTNLASGVWKLTAAASGGCNAPSATCNVTCID